MWSEAYPGRSGAAVGAKKKTAQVATQDNSLRNTATDEPWIRHWPKLATAGGKIPRAPFGRQYRLTSDFLLQGNMKQHMLTHKIRDMPQHMFDKPPTSGEESQLSRESTQHEPEQQPPQPTLQPPQEPPVKDQTQIKRAPTETELPLPKRPPSK